MTTDKEKLERLQSLLHEIDRAIKNNLTFSFSTRIHANKVTWDVHSMAIRSIMIDSELIIQNGTKNSFQWGPKAGDPRYSMEEIADLLLTKIKQAKDRNIPFLLEEDPRPLTELQSAIFKPQFDSTVLPEEPEFEPGRDGEEEGQLDNIEWAVIKHALSKMVENETNPVYLELAKTVLEKL